MREGRMGKREGKERRGWKRKRNEKGKAEKEK